MGVAYYIVLDHEDPGFDIFVPGKCVGRNAVALNNLCRRLGLRALDEFLCMSADEISDLIGEAVDIPVDAPTQWFSAADGLAFFASLARQLELHPGTVKDVDGVLEDLEDFCGILRQAAGMGARWHLAMDL